MDPATSGQHMGMASTPNTGRSRRNSIPLGVWQIIAIVLVVAAIASLVTGGFVLALACLAFAVFAYMESTGKGVFSGR